LDTIEASAAFPSDVFPAQTTHAQNGGNIVAPPAPAPEKGTMTVEAMTVMMKYNVPLNIDQSLPLSKRTSLKTYL
jgi:hypothetical protein